MSNPLNSRNPDGTPKPVLPIHVLALTMEEAVNEGIPLLNQKRKEHPEHFVQVHTYLPQTAHKLFGLGRDVDFYVVGRLVEILRMVNIARSRGAIIHYENGHTVLL